MRSTDRHSYVSGRWLAKSLTGTERYAEEVAKRLYSIAPEQFTIVVPRSATLPVWLSESEVKRSRLDGIAFEQLALPFVAGRKRVISLGGPTILLKRNQLVVLFDAAVFRFPETVSNKFRLWYSLMYRVAAHRVRHLVTISQFSAQDISEFVPTTPAQFALALCGSEHSAQLSAIKPAFDLPQEFVLIVGSLTRRKNIAGVSQLLLDAGETVVVVGAGGSARVFAELSGIPEHPNLILPGRLSDEEIAWLMDHAHALVFPSLYEGFGLPIVEAQSRGCPVVAASTSAIPEVTQDSAILFDVDDPASAVKAIRELRENQSLRADLVDKGHRNAERFSWNDAAQVIADELGVSAR